MKLTQLHGRLLRESLELSEATGAGRDMIKLIDTVVNSGGNFVLVGGHTIGSYTGSPRATKDVDIVSNDWKPIVDAVKTVFPDVEVQDTPIVVRLSRNGEEFLDIIKPKGGNSFYRNVFANAQTVDYAGSKVKIPSIEMALAAKFASMISPYRDQHKQFQDASDFINIVKNNPNIDEKRLASLGNDVYNGGGREVLDKVESVRSGRRFSI